MTTSEKIGKRIIEDYYKINPPSNLQLDSYNTFVNETLPSIIQDSSISLDIDKNEELLIIFKNIYVDKAYIHDEHRNKKYLMPNEARIRDLNYETSVHADLECVTTVLSEPTTKTQFFSRVNLFSLPVMVHSTLCHLHYESENRDECEYDRGGYFIIRGKERVIVAQERINYDKIYVFQKTNSKYRYTGELRSIKEDADYSVLVQVHLTNDNLLVVNLPYINHAIPLHIVYIALGLSITTTDMYENPLHVKCLEQSLQQYPDMSKREALEYISQHIQYSVSINDLNKRVIYTEQILEHEIVPHLGLVASIKERASYLNIIIKKVLDTSSGTRECDDRDHICNKRVEMVGDLIGNLVKSLFKRSLKSIHKDIEKRSDYNIVTLINRFNITPKIYHCFATGNWGIPKSTYIRQGVSQILNRLSYIGTLSHLRRVMVPIGKESKNTKVRQTNSTSFGFIDPIETPEGASCGIVKSFSLLVKVSDNIYTVIVQDTINKFLKHLFLPMDLKLYNVYINGIWICSLKEPTYFVSKFKELRYCNVIAFSVSISIDDVDKEINIASDSGRILRAVIVDIIGFDRIIKSDTLNLYQVLVDTNIISFIDGSEAESSYICMDLQEHLETGVLGYDRNGVAYDYYEIHPSIILGICSSTIPFTDHSQSPRNVYGSAMTKQSIGIFASSFLSRFDTFSHILYYPQKRLVTTFLSESINYEKIPSGINCVIAIACYTGMNVEDSVILNKSAVDRGLFRNVSYKSFSVSETRNGAYEAHMIEQPPIEFQNKSVYNYSKLDADGIISLNSYVDFNDVMIGRVLYENDVVIKDVSKICTHNDRGIIDKVCVTTNSMGYKHVKIRIRRERIPEVGDKLCHITAQKGVCFFSDTLVSLQAGTSKMIKDINIGDKLWGYSTTEDGLQTSVCTNKAYMGMKDTLKITMENGTIIKCTPDHRVLTKTGWVEAGDLSTDDFIAGNLPAPLDMRYPEESTWELHMYYSNKRGDYNLNLHMRDEYNRTKSLAFARILGYILTDGWVCEYKDINISVKPKRRCFNKYRCGAAFGTLLDCQLFIDDLKVLLDNVIIYGKQVECRKEPRFYDSKSYAGACYVYDLPDYMANFIASLKGIPIGRRIESKATMPVFLHTAPLSLVREFLGGLFGGDGCAPNISRDLVSSSIRWKCKEEHKDDLLLYMNTIKDMLHKLGVVSSVSSPNYCNSKARDGQQRMVIGVNIKRTSDFLMKIGFRYCMNKQTKLSAASTYWQMRSYKNKCLEGIGGGNTMSAKNWLEEITATSLFKKGTHCIGRLTTVVPYYYLPISKIEDNGIKPVYDITVDKLESFIANGLIVHNCGAMYTQEDMPFTADGIVPDIIMNPHCITSRMTINTLLETLSGKAGCFSGRIQDSTTFDHDGNDIIEDMGAELARNGFERQGYETLYSGFTGEPMKAQIYMGCGYYHRLKHLVSDKVHARARGDVQELSRQPLSGRSKCGGLRLGEMERDCLVAHGVSAFLKERLFDMSDPYQIDVCPKCGQLVNKKNECENCNNDVSVSVNIPYAAKLLFQELMAMSIKIQIFPPQ